MADTSIDLSLVLDSFTWSLGTGLTAIVIISLGFVLARTVVPGQSRTSRHATRPLQRKLLLEANEQSLTAVATRRALGILAAVVAFIIAAPWLQEPITDLYDRWQVAARQTGLGAYGVLAAVTWLGLAPLAVFLWALPSQSLKRRSLRAPDWATRLGTSVTPGLPQTIEPGELNQRYPHHETLRRACRAYGWNHALWAAAWRHPDDRKSRGVALATALLIVPGSVVLVAAGLMNFWIGAGTVAVVVAASALAGVLATRAAMSAPGTAALDYMLLAAACRDGRSRDVQALAETYLEQNAATQQDHKALITAMAAARWIGEPAWNPVPPTVPEVVIPASLSVIDHNDHAGELHVALRLRYDRDRRWRIARIWTERAAPDPTGEAAFRTPLPVAWA
jgi:hypothetical protein